MRRLERDTQRRGRSAVPATLPRMRRWRRRRAVRVGLVFIVSSSSGALADLAAAGLALVPDALPLVRLGRTDGPDLGGHLPDGLLVDAAHADLGRRGDLEGDAGPRFDGNRVRVADGELRGLAAELD